MAIRQVGSSVGAQNLFESASVTANITNLGQYIEGDYLMVVAKWRSTSAATPTVTSAANFAPLSLIGSVVSMGTNQYMAVWGGFVVPNPASSSSITLTIAAPTTGAGNYVMWTMWRGVDTATPLDGVTPVSTALTAAGTSHALSGVTTGTDGAVACVALGSLDDNGSGGSPVSAVSGTGYSLAGTFGGDAGSTDGSVALAVRTVATAGAAGTATFTTTNSNQCVGLAFSLRPKSSTLVEDVFVGRSQQVDVGPSTGTYSFTVRNPGAAAKLGVLTPTTDDIAFIISFQTDATAPALADPGAPWTPVTAYSSGGVNVQLWWAKWQDIVTWPTFSYLTGAPIDRSMLYACVIRGLDPNGPVDAIAHQANASSTTVTFPTVTPTYANDYLLRGAFVAAARLMSATISAGKMVLWPYGADTSYSTNGSGSAALLAMDKLSTGGGVASGTATATIASAAASYAFTVALKLAPTIVPITSGVDAGAVVVDTSVAAFKEATNITSTVDVGSVAVTTTLTTVTPAARPRRAYVWTSDISGTRNGVIT